jgi:hypothetical protein
MKPPKELDAISGVVLRYKPPEKVKATNRRGKSERPNAVQRKANDTHVYNSHCEAGIQWLTLSIFTFMDLI